jgi:hypothetical protein
MMKQLTAYEPSGFGDAQNSVIVLLKFTVIPIKKSSCLMQLDFLI